MSKKKKPLSEQLRQAVLQAGESRYQISKATGISQPVLSRFVNHVSGLSWKTMDKLAAYLDLELTPRQRTRKDT